MLRVQDQDWLASRLAQLAAADPAIAARLLDGAEDVDVLDEVADLRDAFDEVLSELEDEARDQGDYGEWYPDAEGLDQLFDEAMQQAPQGDVAETLRQIGDSGHPRAERILSLVTGLENLVSRAIGLPVEAGVEAGEQESYYDAVYQLKITLRGVSSRRSGGEYSSRPGCRSTRCTR